MRWKQDNAVMNGTGLQAGIRPGVASTRAASVLAANAHAATKMASLFFLPGVQCAAAVSIEAGFLQTG